MSDPKEGGCQCGAVRYRIEGEPLRLAVCHCKDCQRQSGSAFGMSLILPADSFRLVSGTVQTFAVVCDSRRTKECAFCPACGTRIYHRSTGAFLSVKPGTLDDTSWLVPDAHYWVKRRQRWVSIPVGVAQFDEEQ